MKPSKDTWTDGVPDVTPLAQGLYPLLEELAAWQTKARELGLFVNDRELLQCSSCGLMEDVASDGRLFTCRPEALGEDTGRRFAELSPNHFQCPACGAVIHQADDD